MLWDNDKRIIKLLELHGQGEYNRFSQGDIEYIIFTIKKCAELEGTLNKA